MHTSPSLRISIAALLALAGVFAVLGGLPATRVSAATITVTKTADTNDGTCDADCSLREAVIKANATAGHDNISIPAGTYTLTGTFGEDASATGDLDVTDSVSFNGAGMTTTIINGGNILGDVVIQVFDSATSLILTDLTVTNGEDGGLLSETASIELDDASVSDNGDVGILTDSGSVTLNTGVVDANADVGILTNSGAVDVGQSTISRNNDVGIETFSGDVQADNSTISDNGDDGILTNTGDIDLESTTVASNGGIGVETADGLITLSATIVADNDGGDCDPGVEGDDHSLDTDGSCDLGPSSISNGAPNLGPLQDNGGPTETRDLLAGSDAIDAAGDSCPEDDQRFFGRPAGAACDIGAVEVQGAAPTTTPCDGACPTETATSVTIKTHTPTATGTAAATKTPSPASTNTPAAAATATPQGDRGGVVRGPDTGSGGGGAAGGNGLPGVLLLAIAGSAVLGAGLWRRRA